MDFRVHLSRLLRKKPLETNIECQKDWRQSITKWGALQSALKKTSNTTIVVGYLTAFSYSALLAPSTLPAGVFVASITSLLSEFSKYEFLSCLREASTPCPYTSLYQMFGELPAYIHGWLQLLRKAAIISLLARGLGSVMVHTLGERIIRHHFLFSALIVNEDSIGIISQFLVFSFVLCGLKMTSYFNAAIKIAMLLVVPFLTVFLLIYLPQKYEALKQPITIPKDEFLSSVALMVIAFAPDNKEPRLFSKASTISAYLGANYCVNFLFLVVLAIVFSFLPLSVLMNQKSSSPLLEIVENVVQGPHWFIPVFSCGCIIIRSLSLIEAIHDVRQNFTKMAYDGLLPKKLITNTKWSLLASSLISISLQMTLSTFNLINLVVFIHIGLDAYFGLVIVYRRYCIGTHPIATATSSSTQPHRNLSNQESDSDETDIDVAVDEYKTQVFVSTVMDWNGLEMLSSRINPFRSRDDGNTSVTIQRCLLVVSILILILSLSMRWITFWYPVLISVAFVSLTAIVVILIYIWLHPQKARAQNATFKVLCVPWIPVTSSLLCYVLLFQFPTKTWMTVGLWFFIGLVLYVFYGYRYSRLNFLRKAKKSPSETNRHGSRTNTNTVSLRVSQTLLNLQANSVTVYPQPYQNLM